MVRLSPSRCLHEVRLRRALSSYECVLGPPCLSERVPTRCNFRKVSYSRGVAELAAPRPLHSVPISELRAALLAQPPSFWDSDADVKRVQAPRRDGKMVWLWRTSRQNGQLVTRAGSAVSLMRLVVPIISKLLESYPPGGEVVSAMFPLLPAGGRIPPHRDTGPLLVRSHRIHVPLVVSSGVEFIVDGEQVPIVEGLAFELPNQLQHSVHNHGTENRIHFIFDYDPTKPGDEGELGWLPRVLKPLVA